MWRLRQAWCFRDIRGVCAEDLISEFRSAREISLPLRWPVSLKGESVRGAAKRVRLVQELAEQRAERAATESRSRRYSRRGAAPSVSIRGPLSESLAIVPAAPLAVTPISAVPFSVAPQTESGQGRIEAVMEGAKKVKPQEFVSHTYYTRNKAEEKRLEKKQRTVPDAPKSRGTDISKKPPSDTRVKKAKLAAPEVPGGSSAQQTGLAVGEEGKGPEHMETGKVITTPLGSPIVPPAGRESGKTSAKDPGNVLPVSPGGQPVANPDLPSMNVRDGESVRQFIYAVRPTDIAEQLESKTDRILFMDALKESTLR